MADINMGDRLTIETAGLNEKSQKVSYLLASIKNLSLGKPQNHRTGGSRSTSYDTAMVNITFTDGTEIGKCVIHQEALSAEHLWNQYNRNRR